LHQYPDGNIILAKLVANKYRKNSETMKAPFKTVLLLFWLAGFGQVPNKSVVFLNQSDVKADMFIGYDKFDWFYFVKNNVIYKVKNGESLEYKNLALGKITKVDLLNPLKVIVFYERFNTVVTLDNQLNETLKIDFSQLKMPLVVNKIGIALQNQLWVFDEIMRQLFLYDTSNATLKSVGTPIAEEIIYHNSDFNTFLWVDDLENWYQCSVFGSVQKLDYQVDFDTILFSDNAFIFYKKQGKLYIFDRNTKKINSLENIEKTFTSLTYKNQILSIFTNQGISNYKITIP
jgi:hypothetical protein